MLRCRFGLKGAPRLWAKVLHAVLGRIDLRPTQADPQLYVWHVPAKGARAATADAELELVLIISSHVDDPKGAG